MMDNIENKEKDYRLSNIYEPLDFFMLRAPLLSLKSFNEFNEYFIQDNGKLYESKNDSLILEAISTASPSLYSSLLALENISQEKKKKQIMMSYFRYLLRLTSRSTPFGMFSGVDVGEFGEHTNCTLDTLPVKRVRPDMGWLFSVISSIEKRVSVVNQLRVRRNHAVFRVGGRYTLTSFSHYGQKNKNDKNRTDSISIRATQAVDDAINKAKNPILVSELIAELQDSYPQVSKEKVQNLVIQLLEKELLISELRPPMNTTSPLNYVIECLDRVKGIDTEINQLREIKRLIDLYNNVPLGEGLNINIKLKKIMKNLKSIEPTIQVDVELNAKNKQINRRVAEEIARAAECLLKLSHFKRGTEYLEKFHMSFIDKYGINVEVPILEVLSEEIGLGSPYSDQYKQNSNRKYQIHTILIEAVLRAIKNKEREIEITDEMLTQLTGGNLNYTNVSSSLEMYAEVLANSNEEIDKGNFLIVLNRYSGSQEIGRSFGRFLDILNHKVKDDFRNLFMHQQQSDPDVVVVEASYLPPYGNTANVMLVPKLRDYEITMGTNPFEDEESVIFFEDLFVVATFERLYIKSRKLDKEVVFTSSHMMNTTGTPTLYRFLRDISVVGQISWQPFEWGGLNTSPYLPRVRYGNTILSSARWIIETQFSKLNSKEKALWASDFRKWKEEWSVPRYVFMIDKDQRLLLDLTNPIHLEQLRIELNRLSKVEIEEMVGSFEDRWIKGKDGHHITELVVPLIKKKDLGKAKEKTFTQIRIPDNQNRFYLPGSEWLFLKLYGAQTREEELISDEIYKFCTEAVHRNMAKKWFFVRYSDPKDHIRIRFHGEPDQLIRHLIPAIHKWTELLVKEGKINRIVFDTYEREIERYGGPSIISMAEEVFAADSCTTAQLITLHRYKMIDLPLHVMASISLVDLLKKLGLDFTARYQFLNPEDDKYLYMDEFRQFRDILIRLANPTNDWIDLQEYPNGNLIVKAFTERTESHRRIAEMITSDEELMANVQDKILRSIIHMHCNRLMGTDSELEKKAVAFVKHIHRSQKYWKKQNVLEGT
ncbi:thiopeptide-type bacteriocin biosynthesis protein [Brevibacillus sp. AG162]|uniref:lantibiotic dehydratase n=1 Tax=Brevibacillus sp. AG162 TaxID=2572910 RepID=UPI001154405B|nr:lantibiotic dehydratase [Brevibacillus sp. AG162]TQK53514.1 thiopeptide-type bacteriocin biosynthesis protein [Brevibacillus sp. AG162]